MTKRLELTPKITAAIAKSTENSVDPSTVAVYEWVALNTLPLSKKGTLFENGRVTEATLNQMADFLNGGGFVPMHTLHQQGYELPVGRVFSGQVVTNEKGGTELRVLLYVLQSEKDLLAKIDGGALQEVSVGLKTKHINCSECGFDYLSDAATFDNLWTRTCPNGHTIGTDGVHATMSDMERFLELSFVSLGAANNAKSVSRAKSLLSEAEYNQQLAASGVNPEITHLFASPTPPRKKEPSMDVTKLVDDLTTAKASNQVMEGKLSTAQVTIDTLTASEKALKEEAVALKAAADASKVPGLEKDLKETKDQLDAAVAFVRSEADRLAVAAGLEKPAADADLEAMKASITASKTKLTASIPVGGAAQGAQAGSGDAKAAVVPSSFKTRK